ncbi:hypothetical protein [Lacrimispora celerecrescens]|uniref:hypothetical protein n=1 Tax=Lacrimispora celerecrescens TaxID=29354 RepID=UPI0016456EBD|nr:hypothetical protein [Lacrimispora celerecrescens]
MENTNKTLDVLFSLALNYPVMKHLGFSMSKPIACVMPSIEEAEKVIRYLSPFSSPKVVSANTTPKVCEKMLRKANSEYVFIYYANIPNAKKVLQTAITVVQAGRVGEECCNAIPFIFFQLAIPEEWKEHCFLLYLTENIPFSVSNDNRADDLVEAYFYQDQIVKSFIQKIEKKNSVKGVLQCSAYFLFPHINQIYEDSERVLEEYLDACERLIRMDEDARDNSDTAEVFVSLLYDWVERNNYMWIYPTSKICGQGPHGNLLFDRDFFYISDHIFDEITKPMQDMQSGVLIKQALKDEGMLVCDHGTFYTRKIVTWNAYGEMVRIRVLKFPLNRLNRAADIPLLQLCGIEEEGF